MALQVVEDPDKQQFVERRYDNGAGGDVIHIYRTDNEPQTRAEFYKVAEQYYNTGEVPKGYLALKPGTMQQIRSGFNTVSQPIQQGAAALAESEAPSILGQPGSPANPNPLRGIYELVKRVLPPAAESVKTLERTGATAAGGIAALMSSGLSTLPYLATLGVAGMGGSALAGQLTGNDISFKRDIKEGALVAAAGGATRFYQYALGKGMGKQAAEQIQEDIAGYIWKNFRHLANEPQAFEEAMRSPQFVQYASQKGIKAILGEMRETGGEIEKQILSDTQGLLTTGPARQVRNQLKRLNDSMAGMLENIGDVEVQKVAQAIGKDAQGKILKIISDELKGDSDLPYFLRMVEATIDRYAVKGAQLEPAVQMFKALQRSGQGAGYSPVALQQELANIARAGTMSPVMQDMAQITGRGVSAAIDQPYKPIGAGLSTAAKIFQLPTSVQTMLGHIGPSMGTQYAGTVRGTLPPYAAAPTISVTKEGIRSFLQESKK